MCIFIFIIINLTCQEASVIMLRISDSGQSKVTDLEITSRIEKEVAGLQVPVEDISRVDVLEAPQYLIEEVADVVIAQSLSLQELVEIRFHEALDDVDILDGVLGGGSEDVPDINDVLMIESGEDLDLSQGSLTVRLMLEGANFLDGDLQPQL